MTVLIILPLPCLVSYMQAFWKRCLGCTSSCNRTTAPIRHTAHLVGFWTWRYFFNSRKYSFLHHFRKSSYIFCFKLTFLRSTVMLGSWLVGNVVNYSLTRNDLFFKVWVSPCTIGQEIMVASISTSNIEGVSLPI